MLFFFSLNFKSSFFFLIKNNCNNKIKQDVIKVKENNNLVLLGTISICVSNFDFLNFLVCILIFDNFHK